MQIKLYFVILVRHIGSAIFNSKFDSWLEINYPKNFQIPSFMQIKLYFLILFLHIGLGILNF